MSRTIRRGLESSDVDVELFDQGRSLGRFPTRLNIDQEFHILPSFGRPNQEVPGLQIIDAMLLETDGLEAQMFDHRPLLARFEDGRQMECWLNGSEIVAAGNLRHATEK